MIGGSGVQVEVVECAGVCVRSALKTLIHVAALFRHDNTRTVILKEKGKQASLQKPRTPHYSKRASNQRQHAESFQATVNRTR